LKRFLTTVLPVEYQAITYVRPSHPELYGVGLAALFIFAWLFAAVYWALGGTPALHVAGSGVWALLISVGVLLVGFVAVAFLHELTHGLGLRALGYRPTVGIGPGITYCTVQDIYLTRDQFVAVALIPLVLLSAVGVLVMEALPLLSSWLLLFLVCNAAACVGDLWMVYIVMHYPNHVYVTDRKDGLEIFGQEGDIPWALSNHLVKDAVKGFFVSLLLLFIASEGSMRIAERLARLNNLLDATGGPFALFRLTTAGSGISARMVLITLIAVAGLTGMGFALVRSVTRK
jgi:hypothetical protein